MTAPSQSFRRQSQAHKGQGTTSTSASAGYTGELTAKASLGSLSTDTSIVAAVAEKKIRVLRWVISRAGGSPTIIVFNTKGSGAGTAISQNIVAAANANLKESDNNGLFQTIAGQGLTANNSSIAPVAVMVTYILVD